MTVAVIASLRRQRLFALTPVWARLTPFLLAYAAAFVSYPFGHDAHDLYRLAFVLAVVAAAVVIASVTLLPWDRLPPAADAAPLLVYLAGVAALRAGHGGVHSGYAPMVMLAAVWVALFGRRWLVPVIVVATGLTLALPPLVAGAPDYPRGELRRALLMTLIAALVALVIRALVDALLSELHQRQQAEQQLNRLRATEIHDNIVQALTAAELGLSLGDHDTAGRQLAAARATAQSLAAALFTSAGGKTAPGQLRRNAASSTQPERTPERQS